MWSRLALAVRCLAFQRLDTMSDAPAKPPSVNAAARVDADLVARAYRKVMDPQELTKPERAALKRHEREKEERLRWQYYGSIPQKH